MTTPDDSVSVKLGVAAGTLNDKGHFARAAEKYGASVAAAAQELAADDCLVVAYLQALQSFSFICHSHVPALSTAEVTAARQTACELLDSCTTTLLRREEAGTLLPGRCRPAEVAWFRAFQYQGLVHLFSLPHEAREFADAFDVMVGTEVYFFTACISHDVVFFTLNELQLRHAAFIACALDLLASLPCEPVVIQGKHAATQEKTLAACVHRTIQNKKEMDVLDDEAATLLTDAWQRLERSGVLEQRLLGLETLPYDQLRTVQATLDAATEEGAVRGLYTCALAGCAATEVHVSHFKKCGACKTVAYCCKEHQVEDWPAHKAACKAARKAAAPKADE